MTMLGLRCECFLSLRLVGHGNAGGPEERITAKERAPVKLLPSDGRRRGTVRKRERDVAGNSQGRKS